MNMKKYYFIIGIVVLVIIAGVILISNLVRERPSTIGQMAVYPKVEIEVIVLSLSPYECKTGSYRSPENISKVITYNLTPPYPMADITVVRVDKFRVLDIDKETLPAEAKIYEIDKEELGIKEGETEAVVKFTYTSRPAKIIKIPPIPDRTGLAPRYRVSLIKEEDGYFVFQVESRDVTEESEVILPGLEEGSKFRAIAAIDFSSLKRGDSPIKFSAPAGCKREINASQKIVFEWVDEYEIIP